MIATMSTGDALMVALISFVILVILAARLAQRLGTQPRQPYEITTNQRHTQDITYGHMRDQYGVRKVEAEIRDLETHSYLNEAQAEEAISRAVLNYSKARQLPPPQARAAEIVQRHLGEIERGGR